MTPRVVPTLPAVETPADALAPPLLACLTTTDLAAYLATRRWFGAKGRSLRSAQITDVARVADAPVPLAVAVVEVLPDGGPAERYQLPLAVVAADEESADRQQGDDDIIARVTGGAAVVDAIGLAPFRDWLWTAMARELSAGGDRMRVAGERIGLGPTPAVHPPPSRLLGREQSNSSIVYGDEAVLKLFRRLEPGEHPEVEVGRFLTTRTSFAGAPALLGTLRLDEPERASSVAGMLQAFYPGAVDAWMWMLDCGRQWIREADGAPGTARTPARCAVEARALGLVTGGLHDALASDGADPHFAPARVEGRHVKRWIEGTRRAMRDGLELLDAQLRAGRAPQTLAATARAAIDASSEVVDRFGRIAELIAADPGLRIRHHGDYHLGQVLRTADGGFAIIDFEGEPTRPLADRRARTSALRDVAGMLRSFGYAAAVLTEELDAADGHPASPWAASRMAQWEHELREAFLAGYFEQTHGAPYLPRHRDAVEALLALFELEKAFYELRYELNNRPAWAWIPLRGIEEVTLAVAGRGA
jgi:trehalose synthase-fused probable maltokinase